MPFGVPVAGIRPGQLVQLDASKLVIVPDNRGALIAWSAGVSAVAATFVGVLVSRATTPLSQNPWFIACLVVACLSFAILLLAGFAVLVSWWRSREPRPAAAVAQPTLPAAAITDRWRLSINDVSSEVLQLQNNGMSHPGYASRSTQENPPPSFRVGMSVACSPLDPATPTTSEVRLRFLSFLGEPPVMDLVRELTALGDGLAWRARDENPRHNFAAILSLPDTEEAPVAWARLLLPEELTRRYGRDFRPAYFVLYVEPRSADGSPAPAASLASWHQCLSEALKLPAALAEFLAGQLSLSTSADPAAEIGVWLKAARVLAELIDVDGYASVEGSAQSNWYMGFAMADPDGQPLGDVAETWLRQLCDSALHLDGYEADLASLRPDTGAGQPNARSVTRSRRATLTASLTTRPVMRRRSVIVVAAAIALGLLGWVVFIAVSGTGGPAPASRPEVSAVVRWGHAIALASTGVVFSVSCASAGNCAAGGSYIGGSGGQQAVVASEVNGTWRSAIEVPGTAALNSGKSLGASVNSVSCGSAGNCAAGGNYADASGHQQAFVASEVNGAWHQAIEVPGTGALNTGATAKNLGASVGPLSCPSAGNCAAGGSYTTDASGGQQAFVASEVNGIWHKAIEVPGTAALSTGTTAKNLGVSVNSVSCSSAGNCAAVGWYTAASGWLRAFVASEVNGNWHKAVEVPGTAALSAGTLNTGTGATAVSCPSAGTCAAGGFYSDGSGHDQAFVASEANGTWHKAIEVPGTAALNTGATDARGAWVKSLSCGSAGNCAAGGFYADASGHQQAFVASEANGTWHNAIEVPGTAALNTGASADNDGAWVNSVSCGSAGNCAAGGFYADASGHQQAFVASEANGTWHNAIEVPGSGSLNTGGSGKPLAEVSSVSCPPAGNCAAGGYYTGGYGIQQAFVTDER